MLSSSLRFTLFRFALTAGVLLCVCFQSQAKKLRGDVVVMKNGDRLTGDLKGLQSGVLFIETAYSSENIGVDWNQVQTVQSKALYLITLANGVHLTGSVERTPGDVKVVEDVTIKTGDKSIRLPSSEIVEIGMQKSSFMKQLQGSLDAGISFTSGNSQSTVTTNAIANYTTPKWSATVAQGTSFNNQSGGTKTNRNDTSFAAERFLGRNSYIGGLVDFLHSSQQDLDLRMTAGGGYGRFLKRTGNTDLRWIGGVVYAKETFTATSSSPGSSDSNAEGLLGAQFDAYRFKFGEVHLQLMIFPGLSDYGRIRTTTNNTLSIKLTNNFHFSLSFWDNYDSRPPVTAKNNELGLSTGIGWSF